MTLTISTLGKITLSMTTLGIMALSITLHSTVMEQHDLRSVNNCLNANIYSYLETSGSQSSKLYLNVVHFFNTSLN
jgi:hypothetical protein